MNKKEIEIGKMMHIKDTQVCGIFPRQNVKIRRI